MPADTIEGRRYWKELIPAFMEAYPDFAGFGTSPTFQRGRERALEVADLFDRTFSVRRDVVDVEGGRALCDDVLAVISRFYKLDPMHQPDLGRKLVTAVATSEHATAFGAAFEDLVHGVGTAAQLAGRFNAAACPLLEQLGKSGIVPFSRNFPTFFLMLREPANNPFTRTANFAGVGRELGYTLFGPGWLDEGQYEAACAFAADVGEALAARGWPPHDMLDVTSFLHLAALALDERRKRERGPRASRQAERVRDAEPASFEFDREGLTRLHETFLSRIGEFTSFMERPSRYDDLERRYKDELRATFQAEVLPLVRLEPTDDEGAVALIRALKRLLTARSPEFGDSQNLLYWEYSRFLDDMSPEERAPFAIAFRALLRPDAPSTARVDRFSRVLWPILERRAPRSKPWAPARSLPTFFLMLDHPEEEIYVRTDTFDAAARSLLGHGFFGRRLFDGDEYARTLAFADAMRKQLTSWGWEPQDMIDVYSFLWAATAPKYRTT